jgi:hypothetical protein
VLSRSDAFGRIKFSALIVEILLKSRFRRLQICSIPNQCQSPERSGGFADGDVINLAGENFTLHGHAISFA